MKRLRRLELALCLVGVCAGCVRGLGQDAQPAASAAKAPPEDAQPARLIKRIDPVYPGIAAANQVDGSVVMDVRVEEDGTVKVLKVTHGLPMLISSSVQAVSQWLYEPYRVNGVATPVDTTITLEFRFDKKMLWAVVAPPQPGLMVPSPVVAPALPPPPEGVMRISGHVMAAMLEKRVDPVYPVGSIALDARGTVVLLATVDKSGAVATFR